MSKKLTMPALLHASYITPLRSSDIIISFEEIKLYIYIFRYIDSFDLPAALLKLANPCTVHLLHSEVGSLQALMCGAPS